MRTRYGVSPWVRDRVRPAVGSLSRCRGDRTADVVVIGAGITGCATAYACAAAGLETVVLEAGHVGGGATARGAGLLSPEPGPSFLDVVASHGLRNAKRVFEAWRVGASQGATLLRRLGVRCQLEPREILLVATGEEERRLRKEHAARVAAGLARGWQSPRQLSQRMRLEAVGGIRLRDGFVLDPYRACIGLAAAAVDRGATFFTKSPVTRVRFTRKHAEVMVTHGTVRAGRVVVATGSATQEFKGLRRHFARRETYMVLTTPLPSAMRAALGDRRVVLDDAGEAPYRIQWAGGERLLLSGADQDESSPRARPAVLVQRTGQLMYDLLRRYPVISGLQPEYGWEASYGHTADGLMYIGPHRNYPHHLFALGGTGNVTGAFVASRILLRALQGATEKADEVFGWTR